MSEHHHNREAHHDADLWRWSEQFGRWVRCSEIPMASEIDVGRYDWDARRWVWKGQR